MKKKARKPRRQSARKPATTAIVRVAVPTERPWELSNDQVVLLKNYLKIADASDTELAGCLEVARRYRLDPFKQGQIWFVRRWDKNAVSAAGNKGAYVYTPQVGIYGMLHIAARDHRDYGSVSEAEYGPMITHDVEGHKFKAPEWCRVKAFKKGIIYPTIATIYFEEFCPASWDNARLFWARMPRAQIEKCAKARAVRTAYPDMGGLYIPEEMERINAEIAKDYTPGGRLITVDGVTPSGETVDKYGSRSAAQRVLKDKLAASTQKPIDSEVVDSGQPESQRPKRHATLDWQNPQDPILTGDIQELVPQSKAPYGLLKGLNVTWGKDGFWHVGLDAVKDLRQLCVESGYQLAEILPTETPPKSSGDKGKPETKPSGTNAKLGAKQESVSPTTVSGTIEKSIAGMCGTTPVRDVTILMIDKSKPSYRCFNKKLFEHLDAGLGKIAVFVMKQNKNFLNIVGVRKIGAKEWDENGEPFIRTNREVGTKTFWDK